MTHIAQLGTGRLRTANLYRDPKYSFGSRVANGMFFGDAPFTALAPRITQRLRVGRPGLVDLNSTLPHFDLNHALARRQPSYRIRSTHWAGERVIKQIAAKLFFGEFHVDFLLEVEVAEGIEYPLILQENITTIDVLVYDPPDGAMLVEPPFGVLLSTLGFTRPKPFITGGGGGGGGQVSYGG